MKGLDLCRVFSFEAVQPILERVFPGLRYAAARVGPGSDVLGFDTARSVDHDWGPRLELFLSTDDVGRYGDDMFSPGSSGPTDPGSLGSTGGS